ncbi:MAG: mechanosensitive ion channel family protein [Bacillota bacterium]
MIHQLEVRRLLEGLRLLWETITQDQIYWQLGVSAFIVLTFLLIKNIFTRLIFVIAMRLAYKTPTDMDREILEAFEGPIKGLIVITGFYLSLNYLPLPLALTATVSALFRSAIIGMITWGLYNLVGGKAYNELGQKLRLDQSLLIFASKVLRFIVIALAISIIAQEWDYDVSGFIAGLGLGGLALALAAQDTVSNVFGGIIIILDKPFNVGDWILSPSVEGTVEEMSFRSIKVRTFANALVTVPNKVIVNEAVTNWTRMAKRRIFFRLGVTYTTPREKLQNCVNKIRDLLENHPEVHPDLIMVRFEQFADSSLDIFIYFFTKTKVWTEFLAIKEEINFKIMEILEEEGVSVAFPSRSIYFENQLASRMDREGNRETGTNSGADPDHNR